MRVSRTDCLSNVFLHPKQNLSSVKLLYNFIDKNTGASYKNLMKQKLLFVCTGNICRSPTADGVFRHMVQQANLADLYVGDSAGTHGYHVGERPDLRAIQIGAKRGYSFSDLRARQLVSNDFEEFDYVLAMDAGHLRQMQRMNAGRDHATICMFTDFLDDHDKGIDVPDPYYGDLKGFEQVLDLVEKSTAALIDHLQKQSRQD